MKHLNTFTSALVSYSLLIVGCGGDPLNRNSDPLSNYEQLKTDVPPSQFKSSDQTYDGVLFDFKVEGRHDKIQLDFFEGKDQTYKIQTRVFTSGLSYSLKAHNLPPGARLINHNRGDWSIQWRPQFGTIPSGATQQSFSAQIEFVMDPNSNAKAKELFALDNRNRIKELTFRVHFSDAQPKIQVVGLNKDSYKMGEVISFKVEVTDPNISETHRPDVFAIYDRENMTNEFKTFPASSAVIVDPSRPNQYRRGGATFHFLLDTTTISSRFLKNKNEFKGGEFVIIALNPSGLKSIPYTHRFQISANEPATATASVKE